MALIGYARVSSAGQSLDVQIEQLVAAGCDPENDLFAEKRSGTTAEGREALGRALAHIRKGDVLIVTRLDRLARSVGDLWAIVEKLKAKGVGLRVLQQGEIDTTTPMGKVVLGVMAVFAEFEADLRRDRQLEGIAKAKANKVYTGRKPTLKAADVRRLHEEGMRPAHIAKHLKIARSSVYRLLAEDAKDSGDG